MTLPPRAVAALGLPFAENIPASLADDSEIEIAVHRAVILWNGAERDVRILATRRRPLLGTALLSEQELVAQFVENGLVSLDEV